MYKLYYTVDVEFHDGDYELGPTGHKTINVYEIVNGELKLQHEIEVSLEDNSQVAIAEYLEDNGFGDNNYEFQAL